MDRLFASSGEIWLVGLGDSKLKITDFSRKSKNRILCFINNAQTQLPSHKKFQEKKFPIKSKTTRKELTI